MSYLGNISNSTANIIQGSNTAGQDAATCTTLLVQNLSFDSAFHSTSSTHTHFNEIKCPGLSVSGTRVCRGQVAITNTQNVNSKCNSAAGTSHLSAYYSTASTFTQSGSNMHNLANGLTSVITATNTNSYSSVNPLGLSSTSSFHMFGFLLKD